MPQDTHSLEHTRHIEEDDRPRGILSKRDRRFLLDESYRDELAPQSRRNVRSRLRERVRNALLDFYLLDEHLEDRDRVFSDIGSGMREGLHAAMAFLYRGADADVATFESWIEGGLTHIELEHRPRLLIDAPTVTLNVTPGDSVDPTMVDEKLDEDRLDELTPAELKYLMWKVGSTSGETDAENSYLSGLAHYADWFEEQTGIVEARELTDDIG